jgi:hypothetical protein
MASGGLMYGRESIHPSFHLCERHTLVLRSQVDDCVSLTLPPAVLCCAVLCAGLPQLYGYMLTQRKKVLGGGGAAAAKGKAKAS